MLRTALTDRFGLGAPIVGAPMAYVGGGGLAAAVTSAGGLGMVGVGSATPLEVVAEQTRLAARAGGPFGVGLMAWALAERPELFDAALEFGPSLVSVSFGDYRPWVERLAERSIASATQVGDVDEARAAEASGVDLIVARGSEAGGHGRDRVATLPLLAAVLDAVETPVLAAGGVATGRGLAAALAAGAAGAWVGTALLASPEAALAPGALERLLDVGETDTVVTSVFDLAQGIAWPEGYPGRALANDFSRRWTGHEDELAASPAAREELARARREGDFDVASLYAGQAVGALTRVRPAADVVTEMASGAERLLAAWAPR